MLELIAVIFFLYLVIENVALPALVLFVAQILLVVLAVFFAIDLIVLVFTKVRAYLKGLSADRN